MGQGARPESGKQAISAFDGGTSSCKINCLVVQENSLSPEIFCNKLETQITTVILLLVVQDKVWDCMVQSLALQKRKQPERAAIE